VQDKPYSAGMLQGTCSLSVTMPDLIILGVIHGRCPLLL
jgi:hypothetical protein